MKKIKPGREDNYILRTLIPQLDINGTKILVHYKGGDQLKIEGKHCDTETIVMFLLGVIQEMMDETDNKLFDKAVLEFLRNLEKQIKEEE